MPTGRAPLVRTTPSWRLRPWPNDPTTRTLVFVDHTTVPTLAELTDAIGRAREQGVVRLRTSALFPTAAAVAAEAGFVAIDRLALLRLALDERFDGELDAALGVHRPSTRPMRAWHQRRAAAIDQEAFGPTWGNDAESLAEVRTATPVHRARILTRRRRIAGFAVSGAGGDSGYVQRLAVAASHRREGIGRDLVVDSLLWMRRRGLSAAYVNTGTGNEAALALYLELGFTRLDDELTIAEHDLADTARHGEP